MPLVCYGCGKRKPLINRCDGSCAFYYEERDIGHVECLNERAAEGLSEEALTRIIEYAESCPFLRKTPSRYLRRCLGKRKGVAQ